MVGMALRLESAKIRKIGGTRRLHNRAILIYEVEFLVEIGKLLYVSWKQSFLKLEYYDYLFYYFYLDWGRVKARSTENNVNVFVKSAE
jgi:hypothetical protein